MTTTLSRRTLWDAVIIEPLDLIKAQPPQILISAASAYLIAAEAAVLLPFPANWLLAVGAEWGYLRGMASAASVETPWKDRLTYANGALVVLYGALFSLRQFGALPSVDAYRAGTVETSVLSAAVMTLIHIACIGAITICAMMAHAAMLSHEATVKRLAEKEEHERNQAQLLAEHERNRRWQLASDEIALEMRRKKAELEIEEDAARRKLQLAKERRELRSATSTAQPKRNQPIIYNGQEYPSIQAAADAHGITRQAMAKRLRKES